MEELSKKIVIPLDGSQNALKSLDYVEQMFGHEHHLNVSLINIMPSAPPILMDDKTIDKATYAQMASGDKKLMNKAERLLREGKSALIAKGFGENRIEAIYRKKERGIAQDVCNWADRKMVDAVLITRRGQSDLETFFMGRVSESLVEHCTDRPVWIVGGAVDSKKVLVCLDSSDNALRAVDHAGFMFSGTDCQVTVLHTMRHLTRYVPMETLEDAPDLQRLYKEKAGEQIASYMEKAREMLIEAGLTNEQIATRIVNGSRSPSDDILKEARSKGYGTIVLGRRGLSGLKAFVFGSVTKKILHQSAGLSIWIVQ
jgi:nucleotide-binding universal stress UspA family protein